MKKYLLSFILAIFMLVFTGCSCSGAVILDFSNLWGGNTIGYKESLTYSVEYVNEYAEFGYSFSKSDDLSGLTVEISGSYTVNNEILAVTDESIPEPVKNSDLFTVGSSISSVIKTVATLNLNSSYSFSGKTEVSEDKMVTTAYYFNYDNSFAPIYVAREINYSIPYLAAGGVNIQTVKGSDCTEYSKEKYVISTNYGEQGQKDAEYEYEFKSLIDNSAIFMAIRNKNIDKDATYSIPTVTPAYGKATTLNVKHFDNTVKKITMNYNGTEKTADFSLQGISFVVNSLSSSGTPQLVFVQNGDTDGIKNSLIVNYVEPLVEYGGLLKYGALIYTLISATYA